MARRSRIGLGLASLLVALTTPPDLAAAPRSRWRHAIPGWGEPAAGGAMAFVLTQGHEVLALDARTGTLRWHRRTGGSGSTPRGSVVRLVRGLVIVGDGDVVAFDRDSGDVRWRFAAGDAAGVFLGAADEALVFSGSVTGTVHAIDAASGAARWSRRLGRGAGTVFPPAVSEDGAVVVSHTTTQGALRGGLTVLDRHGGVRWRLAFERGVGAAGAPVATAGLVIAVRTDGEIVAFDVRTGRRQWNWPKAAPSPLRPHGTRDLRALVAAGDVLVAGSMSGELVAYDVRSGAERWRYRSGPEGAPLRLRAIGDTVVAPYTDGTVVALDAATGVERWRLGDRRSPIEWPPAAAAGIIVASGSDAIEGWLVEPAEGEPGGGDRP